MISSFEYTCNHLLWLQVKATRLANYHWICENACLLHSVVMVVHPAFLAWACRTDLRCCRWRHSCLLLLYCEVVVHVWLDNVPNTWLFQQVRGRVNVRRHHSILVPGSWNKIASLCNHSGTRTRIFYCSCRHLYAKPLQLQTSTLHW